MFDLYDFRKKVDIILHDGEDGKLERIINAKSFVKIFEPNASIYDIQSTTADWLCNAIIRAENDILYKNYFDDSSKELFSISSFVKHHLENKEDNSDFVGLTDDVRNTLTKRIKKIEEGDSSITELPRITDIEWSFFLYWSLKDTGNNSYTPTNLSICIDFFHESVPIRGIESIYTAISEMDNSQLIKDSFDYCTASFVNSIIHFFFISINNESHQDIKEIISNLKIYHWGDSIRWTSDRNRDRDQYEEWYYIDESYVSTLLKSKKYSEILKTVYNDGMHIVDEDFDKLNATVIAQGIVWPLEGRIPAFKGWYKERKSIEALKEGLDTYIYAKDNKMLGFEDKNHIDDDLPF
jgi:hypothetical protein